MLPSYFAVAIIANDFGCVQTLVNDVPLIPLHGMHVHGGCHYLFLVSYENTFVAMLLFNAYCYCKLNLLRRPNAPVSSL